MKLPLKFRGADMSASTRTDWVKLPAQAKRCAIDLGWPATGTPIGTLSIELSNDSNAATGAAYPIAIATNPTGGAGSILLDNIQTSARFLAVVYAVTSGGVGAAFTGMGGAGTAPTVEIKE